MTRINLKNLGPSIAKIECRCLKPTPSLSFLFPLTYCSSSGSSVRQDDRQRSSRGRGTRCKTRAELPPYIRKARPPQGGVYFHASGHFLPSPTRFPFSWFIYRGDIEPRDFIPVGPSKLVRWPTPTKLQLAVDFEVPALYHLEHR